MMIPLMEKTMCRIETGQNKLFHHFEAVFASKKEEKHECWLFSVWFILSFRLFDNNSIDF